VREYPTWHGDPYYPVPSEQNERQFQQYRELAKQQSAVSFVGRLAEYRYYNMDQVVGAALKTAEQLIGRYLARLGTTGAAHAALLPARKVSNG
jgi:UDP-galactopyranose mutase